MSEIVTIEEGCLVIRMDRATLATAAKLCPRLEFFDENRHRHLKVTVVNPDEWLRSVARALTHEKGEDGTTLVHEMFDAAFLHAYEQGLEGLEIETPSERRPPAGSA